ncbi:hypothetical protein [Hydrogenophaga sp.]|uniref:hypothetical protein n=1 Tax=Hydrogenophaga sp. TaxID=1904254 RepID=UPI0027283F4E|nr:hypothetical protein [Hydrogenophaga sp.]MDO9437727.1 hypothetical protein [Hydrogenophaga sp.]
MFVTHLHLEQKVPAGLAPPLFKFWRGVSLSLETSWYLCVTARNDGGTETFLVAWEVELLEFIAAAGANLSVRSIARIDKSRVQPGRWEMRWIDALWTPSPAEQAEAWQVVMRFEGAPELHDEHLNTVGQSDARQLVFSESLTN